MYKVVLVAVLFLYTSSYALAQEATPSKELVQYIQSARSAGLKDPQIQQNAEKAGWPTGAVKGAFEFMSTPTAKAGTPAGAAVAPVESGGTPAQTPENTPPPAAAPAGPDPGAKPATVNRGVADEYQIGGGDVISINVWGEPSASVPQVVVRPDGKISMPLVKEVFVAGLTPTQLEKVITDELSEKIKAADVTVVVNQINSKKVFLLGSGVKREGPISFSYGMTVMQALSEAGGLSDYAKRKKIYVLRKESGRQFKLPFDYDAVLRGEHMETNYPLIAGDIVVVPIH